MDQISNRPRGGFSLIEVIVVVAVMAVVAAVAVPMVDVLQRRERGDATLSEMQGLQKGLEAYFEEQLAFPPALSDLATGGYIAGGFSASDPVQDAWGTNYVYTPAATTASLRSYGPDLSNAAPNYDLAIDGTRFLRARTMGDLSTLENALRNYEARRVPDALPPLPATWYNPGSPGTSALGVLIARGYVANDLRYASDAWGSGYSYLGTPSTTLASAHVG